MTSPAPSPLRLPVLAADAEASAREAARALPPGGVLYYALGGGLGHLTRGLAIGRHFRRISGAPFALLTTCPVPVAEPVDLILLRGSPGPADLARLVAALARQLRPAALGVDAFPAGILGELPPLLTGLACRRVAVLRRLQPHWAEQWNLPDLLARAYHAVALVEEGAGFPGFPPAVRRLETSPVLIRDAEELLPAPDARRALGIRPPQPPQRLGGSGGAGDAGTGPLVLAVSGGMREAERRLLQVAAKAVANACPAAQVRFATAAREGVPEERRIFHYPLIEWLPGADLVIGACGYHLFHEARAVGVPAIFVPQPRLYDDQFARAAGSLVARSPEELEALIGQALSRAPEARPAPAYENGAATVARLLAEMGG